jgi:hypothetical protein
MYHPAPHAGVPPTPLAEQHPPDDRCCGERFNKLATAAAKALRSVQCARIAIYASLCVAGTHAWISVHGRDDIQDIVTTDGLLAFSRNLSLAMMRRTGLAERDQGSP